MKKMIAYCGLDCEKCDAYLATIHDDQALREKTAKAWAELNHAPILPEHINCQGCRADGIKTVFCDSLCEIRQCALQKGVETCADCSELEKCQTVGTILADNPEALKNLKRLTPPSLFPFVLMLSSSAIVPIVSAAESSTFMI